MTTLKLLKKNIYFIISIMVLVSFIGIPFVNSYDNDNRYRDDSSSLFSPGYLNAAKYQAETVKYQANMPNNGKNESLLDKAIDYAKDKLGYTTNQEEQAQKNAPPPVLQQKRSSAGKSQASSVANVPNAATLVNSLNYNVNIGSGTNQVYAGGRLMSEKIGGITYVYVGFDKCGYNASALQSVINTAPASDIIILKGSKEGTQYAINTISNEVSIFGGYDENGVRDVANNSTILNTSSNGPFIYLKNTNNAEFDGLTFNNNFTIANSGAEIYNCTFLAYQGLTIGGGNSSLTVTICNNTFSDKGGTGISVGQTNNKVIIEGNTFSASCMYGIDAFTFNSGDTRDIHLSYNNFYTSQWAINAFNSSLMTSDHNNFLSPYSIETGAGGAYYSSYDYFKYYNVYNSNGCTLSVSNRADSGYDIVRPDTQNQIYSIAPAPGKPAETTLYSTPLLPTNTGSNYYLSQSDYLLSQNIGATPIGNTLKQMILNKINALDAGGIGNPQGVSYMKTPNDNQAVQYAIVPAINGSAGGKQSDAVISLINILNNPTEDQKAVLDVVKSLLADIDKVAKEQGKENVNNPELNKVQDDILNIVAKVLLAQAIPDLLKKGDIENIKGIFANLDSTKTRIILEYKESTTPYYDELKKLLERNTSALDLNLKNKLEKELKDMSRSEIDRIVERLKQKENRTFEEDYILQQEQKVRAKYLDPNKKKLEADMTIMLQGFTKKLATTLESTKR